VSGYGTISSMEGHVYVVEFESGMVKVGYSAKPENRFKGYVKNGVLFGNPVTRTWVSPAHFAPQRNEKLMITFCAERGSRANGGQQGEYFTGVPFGAVQRYAASLEFEPFDRERWRRREADRLSVIRALWGSPGQARHVPLPPQAGVPASTLGEWFELLNKGGAPDDLPEDVADLFDVDLDDLLRTPASVHQRVLAYVADIATCRLDVEALETALAAARSALSEQTGVVLDSVRQEVQDAVIESIFAQSTLRKVRLANGTEAMIRVKSDVSQEQAERLAADYLQPGG
jgi:hypothetical protein